MSFLYCLSDDDWEEYLRYIQTLLIQAQFPNQKVYTKVFQSKSGDH